MSSIDALYQEPDTGYEHKTASIEVLLILGGQYFIVLDILFDFGEKHFQ